MRIDPTKWLGQLDRARAQALAGDAEGIHHVRSITRRLRVWLAFKGHEALQGEAQWLCHALARLRDLDVFDSTLTTEARARHRPPAMETARKALESARWLSLREQLERVKPPKKARAKRELSRLERQLKKRRSFVSRGDGVALHRLRRALRRVRYAREWLGLDAKELAREQDRLGVMCDLLALQALAQRHHTKVPAQLAEGIATGFELLFR